MDDADRFDRAAAEFATWTPVEGRTDGARYMVIVDERTGRRLVWVGRLHEGADPETRDPTEAEIDEFYAWQW